MKRVAPRPKFTRASGPVFDDDGLDTGASCESRNFRKGHPVIYWDVRLRPRHAENFCSLGSFLELDLLKKQIGQPKPRRFDCRLSQAGGDDSTL